ncbi:beta-lactamase family protein [Shewanella sp. AS1]|nr:beta-lactamase family protein [Shewanella sp. AS1]
MYKFVFCVLLFSLSAINSLHASPYQSVVDNFKHEFEQKLAKSKVPGGALVVVDGDRIIGLNTYGKRRKGGSEKIDKDTVFRLASVSKTFAGALASMLVHEHKLSWQQPINTYIPTFSLQDLQASQSITLGHIVGQSTGLMPNSYDNLINANVKFDKILPKFTELSPICNPGVCYSYQNVAFSFIEQAIEQQSGHSYAELLNQRIFAPLEMNTASIGFDAFNQLDNRAEPHVKTRLGFRKVTVRDNYYQLAPAAGVNASISDLAKWLMANMGQFPAVIPKTIIEDITTPGVRTTKELRRREWRSYLDDAHYGKGWRIYEFEGEALIYHAGWVSGYVAEIAYSPKLKLGMAMLLNGESRVIAELGAEFWHRVFNQHKQNQQLKQS